MRTENLKAMCNHLLITPFLVFGYFLTTYGQVSLSYPDNVEAAIPFLKDALASNPSETGIITVQIDSASDLTKEGFQIQKNNREVVIKAAHQNGALYGVLDIAEQFQIFRSLDHIQTKTVEADLEVRAIKFNLPWSAYRECKSMDYHLSTCRDTKFWQSFLDMMMQNRFNTLLLYNKHPFSFMVALEDYPEASPFSSEEMQGWQNFWKTLFRMARERGIEVFIVNWNIVVSDEFARHHQVEVYNDTSQLVIDYTKVSVTKLINTYEDLAGIGVTLADWMVRLTPRQKEDWIKATFIEGMREADRKVKFLHRAVLSGSSDEMRRILDDTAFITPVLTEIKFNWSHGHSTPTLFITHASERGEVNRGFWEPAPVNYKIQWMIRNEDFFILRWGEPEFIRAHIRENTQSYMNGYHIGSEGTIPAYEYFTRAEIGRTWQYAFERQWLWYMLWGRLLYDIETPDSVFENAFNQRYGPGVGKSLLSAYSMVSRMPLHLSSFFKSTWDYTLYAEGFLAPRLATNYGIDDQGSPFISINELIDHQVLDSNYLSIKDFVKAQGTGDLLIKKLDPLSLAGELNEDANLAIAIISQLEDKANRYQVAFQQELDDIWIWALLSKYFSHKLIAGVALEQYRNTGSKPYRESAIQELQIALQHWQALSSIGNKNYREVPYWESTVFEQNTSHYNTFSWSKYLPEVERDIEIAQEE